MARLIYYTKAKDHPLQWRGQRIPIGEGGLIETEDQKLTEYLVSNKLAEQENLGKISTLSGTSKSIKELTRPELLQELANRSLPPPSDKATVPQIKQFLHEYDERRKELVIAATEREITINDGLTNGAIEKMVAEFDQKKAEAVAGASANP